MAEETHEQQPAAGTPAVDIFGRSTGILVFVVGIALLVLVFFWAYQLFNNIEQHIDTVAPTQVASSSEGSDSPPNPGHAASGRTLAQVAAIIGLKIAAIFALGYCASLVAGKGIQMTAAHRGKRSE
ncbi:MAG: hypothetical protein ACE5R4_01535 [Armatimonadota bacterium]